MEENRKPRNKPIDCQLILTKKLKIYNGERTVSSINGIGKTNCHRQKNETGPLYYTAHKNQLKMNCGLEYKTCNCKTPRIKYREWSPLYWFWQCFVGLDFESKGFPGLSADKESTCEEGDLGLSPGLGRSPGEKNSYPLLYSGLQNSLDYSPWGRKELDMIEKLSLKSKGKKSKNKLKLNKKDSAQQRKPPTKGRDNLWNRRKYLQIYIA